jgi:hypothetical protein
MTAPLFEIGDDLELFALWRLVAEAKFHADPDDTDLWRSPIVHQLATRIADAMLRSYETKGDVKSVEHHRAWRASLPNNVVLPAVKKRLKRDASDEWWERLTLAEKVSYVRGCVAPFDPGQEFIEGLVREAEA